MLGGVRFTGVALCMPTGLLQTYYVHMFLINDEGKDNTNIQRKQSRTKNQVPILKLS